jgi:hypothetical protein
MPSPLELGAIRAGVRDAVTAALDDLDAEAMDARLTRIGEDGGRSALFALAALVQNGMVEFTKASPGAQMGGTAGYLQIEGDRFGEPHASICRGILEIVRQAGASGSIESPKAQRALDAVWDQWGAVAVGHGVSLIVLVYDLVAQARGVTLAQAWAVAAEADARGMDQTLSAPAALAVQQLWEAGFSEAEIDALTARLQSMVMGAQESGGIESVSLADLATTPEREAAMQALVDTLRAESRRTRQASGARRAKETRDKHKRKKK